MLRQIIGSISLAAGLCCSASSALAAEAGRIVFVAGQARVAAIPAALDAAVQEGDEISTGADGYIYLKTVDSGFLILRPNSKARIVAYHIDQANPANTRVKLELLSGVARSISGQAVKQARQNFRFNTPVAAIGVRGTDFIVYTDELTSRVAVVSGGVVVSGFAGACGPEGSGPCEGRASRELFAGQSGMLLQIRRGENMPQLLHSPALSPDQSAPPRIDEPVGKVTTVAPALPHGLDVNLDAKKGTNPLINGKPGNDVAINQPVVVVPPLVVEPPVVVAPPVVVVPPVVVAPPVVVVPDPNIMIPAPAPAIPYEQRPKEVLWGRWQQVADMKPDKNVLARLSSDAYLPPDVVGNYTLSRMSNSGFVMPGEGRASFALKDSEATLQQRGYGEVMAEVKNARLDVDFSARSFSTSLSVVGGIGKVDINTSGDITRDGRIATSVLSPTVVRGYLGGKKADEAVYIFQSDGALGLTANGVTRWSR